MDKAGNVISSALIGLLVWAILYVGFDAPEWAAVGFAIVVYLVEVNVPFWRKAAGHK